MFAPRRLVEALAAERVSYVVIGGLALTMHGSARATFDLDLCYDRDRENLRRLARALPPLHPRLRDFPPELPFFFDEATLRSGLNFTMRSDAGDVDLLGEVPGLGGYAEALAASQEERLYDTPVRILTPRVAAVPGRPLRGHAGRRPRRDHDHQHRRRARRGDGVPVPSRALRVATRPHTAYASQTPTEAHAARDQRHGARRRPIVARGLRVLAGACREARLHPRSIHALGGVTAAR